MNSNKIKQIAVTLTLCATLAACGRNALPAPAATTTTTTAAAPAGTPREVVLQALRAKLAAKSYRMKNTQTGPGGINNVMEVEYVSPHSYHARVEGSEGGGERGGFEMIAIGEQGFMKAPGGGWQRKRVTPEQMTRDRMKEQMLIDNLAAAGDDAVRYAGTDSLNGKTAYIYEYAFDGVPDVPARSRTKTWVGAENGFPMRVEMEAEMTRRDNLLRLNQVTEYWDYGADIRITAPE